MRKRWRLKTPNPHLQVQLSDQLAVHPIISQLLVNRGIESAKEAKEFLYSGFKDLHDPFLLKDMDRAISRIQKARAKNELVMVYGDYDVDGITASAIMAHALERFGLKAINHIPHRMTDGYGLNHTIAKEAKEKGVKLLVAVDCGISAFDEVETLRAEGIEVIVVDHHEPLQGRIPAAVAVVDPKRDDCPYPFGGLAAVALAFKVAQALLGKDYHEDLDLVALGTVADIVPLHGENRIFVKSGLPKIEQTQNIGLRALLSSARIQGKKLTPRHVGFVLGPRINAMGRIDSAQKSLQLLLSKDVSEAEQIAQVMEEQNRLRQRTQSAVVEEAIKKVEQDVNFSEERVIVVGAEGWHRGIVGIVASRIADQYYRPCVVLSYAQGIATGSARSIEGFHLFDALKSCGELLENFGGHKYAAGLTLKVDNVPAFRKEINEIAIRSLKNEDLVPTLFIDCEIPIASVDLGLIDIIQKLEPYGEGNPEPVFCSRNLIVKSPAIVVGKGTIKFWVTDGKKVFQAVGFGMEEYRPLVKERSRVDLAYKVSIDDWNKEPAVQLELKDIRESRG